MAAELVIAAGTAPQVSPDTVDTSNVSSVWFQFDLSNTGNETGSSVNYYCTIEDPSGTNFYSAFLPDDEIGPGSTSGQGVNIDAGTIGGLAAGDYWVSVRESSGSIMGSARLTVISGSGAVTQLAGDPTVSPDTVSVANPVDVAFDYDLANMGTTDDTATGFYVVVNDGSGNAADSVHAPDATLPAEATTHQTVTFAAATVQGWTPGDYWVMLHNPSGEVIGAAALTVTE